MNPPNPQVTFFPDGADDCPLIEISGTDFHTSRELYHAIRGIRDSMAGSFGLHELPGFEGCTHPKVYFEVSETNIGIQSSPDGDEFTCKLTYDGWICVEDSLASFCHRNSSTSGFQWLYDSDGISLLYSPSGGW